MRTKSMLLTAMLLLVPLLLSGCGESPKPSADAAAVPAVAAETVIATPAGSEVLAPAEPAASLVPTSVYEGKIVRRPPSTGGKEDGWFFVKDGKRRWISDAAWLEKNGYQVADVLEISAEELQAIPEDMEAIAP